MFDEKEMYDHFTTDRKIKDGFMLEKMRFIKQLIKQRELKIKFQEIDPDENLSLKNILQYKNKFRENQWTSHSILMNN